MAPNVYLPIIHAPDPLEPFGAQIDGHVVGVEQWIVPNRIYQIPVRWDGYAESQALYDRDAEIIRQAGGRVAIGIRCVPLEYRLWPEYVASPPKPTAFPSLADFVGSVALRLGACYVELFNEPNVGRDAARQYETLFGAWMIDGEDPTLSGRRYGSMLRAVYPHLHALGLVVYAGALMLNSWWSYFLQGIGNAPLDCVSWHCYLTQDAPFTRVDDIARQIRIINPAQQAITETSVLSDIDSAALMQRQADWLKYLVDTRVRLGMRTVTWYCLAANDWMHSDLVHNGDPSTPGYLVFSGKN
jgi:hypothetical protein